MFDEEPATQITPVESPQMVSTVKLPILKKVSTEVPWNKDAKSPWTAIKKGLDKAYDRFQKLISLLEVHGTAVSNKDANQKFLRALPLSWNNVALIMRNKDGSSGSSSNSQNVAFLFAEDTSSSNEVNTANGVSTASGHNSQG
ncbi:hypothetical protein Tco_0526139 [Tanacetum coccineum]